MSTPIRVQLSRRKGSRIPAFTVNVARPSRWGNPFVVQADPHGDYTAQTNAEAVRMFEEWIDGKRFVVNKSAPTKKTIKLMLAGCNLACWCKLGEPCHADVLLKIANAPAPVLDVLQLERLLVEGRALDVWYGNEGFRASLVMRNRPITREHVFNAPTLVEAVAQAMEYPGK